MMFGVLGMIQYDDTNHQPISIISISVWGVLGTKYDDTTSNRHWLIWLILSSTTITTTTTTTTTTRRKGRRRRRRREQQQTTKDIYNFKHEGIRQNRLKHIR